MGKGGGKQSTESTPWKGAIPYLTGGKDAQGNAVPGVFNEAARLYGQNSFTPEMQNASNVYASLFPGRLDGSQQMISQAANIAGGQFDTVNKTAAPVQAGVVDASARQGQGVLDPTRALSSLLTGQVQNKYLDPLAQNITQNITRNTLENALPAVRSEALGSGMYGGSRQALAEAKTLSRMNQDIATGVAPMYAQAFENAQNRQASAASELNLQAERVATGNADRNLNANQFNSNLTLQGNQQNLAANQANLNNRMKASDLYGQAQNFQDTAFQQYQQMLQMPQQYDLNNLARYAGIIQPGAGLGGTQTQTAQQGRNPIAGAAGGALAGATFGPVGAAIGGGLGLLSGLL